jgi:HSP20 family protein
MNLVRWDPFRDLSMLQSRVNRLFGDTLLGQAGEEFRGWAPVVDIFERGDDLVLRAEIPGVRKEDLDLRVEGNVLTLRGERTRDEKVAEENYHRIERSYGAFSRSFTLPSTIDASRIDASYKDGVLELILPKAEEAKPKRIEVKTA